MANSISNQKRPSRFPLGTGFNKREARMSSHCHSCAVVDSAFSLSSDDGIDYVRSSGAITVTLPKAAESAGRRITFLQSDANILTIAQNADGANIDGAASDFTSLDAADDWAEFFCTGSEWIIVKQVIA